MTEAKNYLSAVILLIVSLTGSAQKSVDPYKVALLLPFQYDKTDEQLESIIHAKDYFTATKVRMNDNALLALDFYQGVLLSLKEQQLTDISLYTYDCGNSDSSVNALLKNPDLKGMNVIVGPVSTSAARLVARYCKENSIVNIQPFTPSKSLTLFNPYHIKLAPTIDSHIDALFQSMIDSFQGAHVIIYTPSDERSLPVAVRLDSLIRNYNRSAARKFGISFINTKDMMVDGRKTTAMQELKSDRKNILFLSSYDEPFVNGNLRSFYEASKKFDVTLFGMPTWLSGDVIRLDYLNEFRTRVSSGFYADTSKEQTSRFNELYRESFETAPSEFSYLGYDVSNWLCRALSNYGVEFPTKICTERYNGCGFKFDITRVNATGGLNYYENKHVNVFRIENYKLVKE